MLHCYCFLFHCFLFTFCSAVQKTVILAFEAKCLTFQYSLRILEHCETFKELYTKSFFYVCAYMHSLGHRIYNVVNSLDLVKTHTHCDSKKNISVNPWVSTHYKIFFTNLILMHLQLHAKKRKEIHK